MVTFFIFVLTFSSFDVAFSNFHKNKWVFNFQNKKYIFNKIYTPTLGENYFSLLELKQKFKIRYDKNKNNTDFTIWYQDKSNALNLSTRHNEVFIHGKELSLALPVLWRENTLWMPFELADKGLRQLLGEIGFSECQTVHAFETNAEAILIDPGHGGNDYGAEIKKKKGLLFEKDLNLVIAQELKKYFHELKIPVVLSRNNDCYLSLKERAEIERKVQPKFFLSLHFNYHKNKKLRGHELFLLSLNEKNKKRIKSIQESSSSKEKASLSQNKNLQKIIERVQQEEKLSDSLAWAQDLNGALENFFPSKKTALRMAPFFILNATRKPALLLELAYLSSPEDIQIIFDPEQRKKLLMALVESVSKRWKVVEEENAKTRK